MGGSPSRFFRRNRSSSVSSPLKNGYSSLFLEDDTYWDKHDDIDIVKCILGDHKYGKFGETDSLSPLFVASYYGLTEVVEVFIEKKFDVSSPDKHGFTPLYIASFKGHTKLVELLISAGVNVNETGKGHNTPLYVASKKGYVEIVNILLQAKADVCIPDHDGLIPYEVASDSVIKKMLLEAHEAYGPGLCAICWERPVNSIFTLLPCRHNILCRSCHKQLIDRHIDHCPMCRTHIYWRNRQKSL